MPSPGALPYAGILHRSPALQADPLPSKPPEKRKGLRFKLGAHGAATQRPGSERFPGEGSGNPRRCSCLQNSHGQRSLAGCGPLGRKESDATERLTPTRSGNSGNFPGSSGYDLHRSGAQVPSLVGEPRFGPWRKGKGRNMKTA